MHQISWLLQCFLERVRTLQCSRFWFKDHIFLADNANIPSNLSSTNESWSRGSQRRKKHFVADFHMWNENINDEMIVKQIFSSFWELFCWSPFHRRLWIVSFVQTSRGVTCFCWWFYFLPHLVWIHAGCHAQAAALLLPDLLAVDLTLHFPRLCSLQTSAWLIKNTECIINAQLCKCYYIFISLFWAELNTLYWNFNYLQGWRFFSWPDKLSRDKKEEEKDAQWGRAMEAQLTMTLADLDFMKQLQPTSDFVCWRKHLPIIQTLHINVRNNQEPANSVLWGPLWRKDWNCWVVFKLTHNVLCLSPNNNRPSESDMWSSTTFWNFRTEEWKQESGYKALTQI